MKFINLLFWVFMATSLFGCAHPIVVAPKTEKIVPELNSQQKINANVGFFISPEVNNLEVTTQGGGGDNVRYYPYRDIEVGYQRMLLNVFDNAIKLKSANDNNELSRSNIQFTLEPILITTSGSTGFFTWPPTNFTVDLTCKIRDSSGKEIGNPRVVGNGQHTEGVLALQGDFGLAGRRAMEDALMKMQRALLEFKYPNNIANTVIPIPNAVSSTNSQPNDQISARLEKLKKLFDSGVISKVDYEQKKKEIIDSL
jgi:hypothetical protein